MRTQSLEGILKSQGTFRPLSEEGCSASQCNVALHVSKVVSENSSLVSGLLLLSELGVWDLRLL